MNKKLGLICIAIVSLSSFAYALDLLDGSESSEGSDIVSVAKTETEVAATAETSSEVVNAATPKNNAEDEQPSQVQEFDEFINMSKWEYNEEDHVYYQIGITYCRYPADETYEKLAVFVPEKYMDCKRNIEMKYTCQQNPKNFAGIFNAKYAPMIINIDSLGYKAVPALTEYTSAKAYTDEGIIYVHAGFRGREHGAPLGVTDLKAAIRYLKRNQGNIPGNTDRIFVTGLGDGGGMAVILGASGDSAIYRPYLQEIGAIQGRVDDSVFGVGVWCPITNLDTANEAYEWNFGQTRANMTDEQKKLSDAMAKSYAQYINRAGFMNGRNGALTLQQGDDGVYQSGTYYDYVQRVIETSFSKFFKITRFPYVTHAYEEKEMYQQLSGKKMSGEDLAPADDEMRTGAISLFEPEGSYLTNDRYLTALNSPTPWATYDANIKSIEITNVKDFMIRMKPATKAIGAFDSLHRVQSENLLFGTGDGQGVHFDQYTAKIMEKTEYSNEFKNDLKKQDKLGRTVSQRMDMYNPLYFLMPSYAGFRTSKVAPYWRIRSGINQGDAPLTTEINLFLALNNYPNIRDIDFETIWGVKHVDAEWKGSGQENAIKWIIEIMRPR